MDSPVNSGVAAFEDTLFSIRGRHQRTLTDLDHAKIIDEGLRALEDAARDATTDQRAALRKSLEEFLLLRVAALLPPHECRAFVSELRDRAFSERGGWKSTLGPGGSHLLRLRIALFMARRHRLLFFENQYGLFARVPVQRLVHLASRVGSTRSLAPLRRLLPHHLELDNFSVIITTKCTLRCEHCGAMLDFPHEASDLEEQAILETLRRVQSYADHIETLGLTGGEPFCNPNLKRYLQAVSTDVCGKVELVTNGTLLPTDPELYQAMRDHGVRILFSNYGPLSSRQDEFIKRLEEHGIPYRIQSEHRQWYDQGGVEPRRRTRSELNRQFAKCSGRHCVNALDGHVHLCTRSSFGASFGLIDVPAEDYVDILALDKREFVRQMRRLLARDRALAACRHCSYGEHCPAIPKAVQMKMPSMRAEAQTMGPRTSTAPAVTP